MKRPSLFLPFMALVAAAGLVQGFVLSFYLSAALTRLLVDQARIPLEMASSETTEMVDETFHRLLDDRKEEDPEAIEVAQRNVLSRIQGYRPRARRLAYHFVVLDETLRPLTDSSTLFDPSGVVQWAPATTEGEISLQDRQGKRLVGFQRYFPGWHWHILTVVYEDDLQVAARRVEGWVFGAGTLSGFLLMVTFYLLLRYKLQLPLQSLAARALEMREGRYFTHPVTGTGEVQQLSEAFNTMASAIQSREARLRELAKFTESSPNLMMKVALDGRVLYANLSITRFLESKGLPSDHPEALLPPELPAILGRLEGSSEREMVTEWTVKGRVLRYSIFRFDDGESCVLHGEDVTERRSTEEQLFHSQKMEIIGQIAGGVAHDFNNLLAAILGYASLMKNTPAVYTLATKAIDNIEKAGLRGSQLTRQLLGFSRKGTHERLPVDLNRLVDETFNMLAQTLMKTVRIVLERAPDLPMVNGDSTQLLQCLMNLCLNARDAMPNGGTITITTRQTVFSETQFEPFFQIPKGVYAEFEVADDGTGMDAAVTAHMFDPFFTTKAKGKGTGLGLSLVYGTVKNHEGYILVQSTPGEGTRIRLLFPEGAAAYPTAVPPPPPLVLPVLPGQMGVVLVVDDEDLILDMVQEVLHSLGYRVLLAHNGQEGVEVFSRERGRIAVVLLDLMMPVMGGRAALEKMLQIDPAARVVISTGFSGSEDVENLKHLGAKAILSKPYTHAEIARTIRQVASS